MIRKIWIAWRRLAGDDAYERYVAHLCATQANPEPLSRHEFWQRQLVASKAERCLCCDHAVRLDPAANHARLKRLLVLDGRRSKGNLAGNGRGRGTPDAGPVEQT